MTFKKPETRNINKFTPTNIIRWIAYYSWIKTVDPKKVKFLDEVHFEPRSLRRRRGISLRGTKIISVEDEFIKERYSMVLMTSVCNIPFTARMFKDTINSIKFCEFLFDCCFYKRLVAGDILILDNAAIHFSKEVYEIMMAILNGAAVKVVFLPTYSPEFNPCELVFGLIKNWIRNNRGEGSCLLNEIRLAMASITMDHIKAFYQHCMHEASIV